MIAVAISQSVFGFQASVFGSLFSAIAPGEEDPRWDPRTARVSSPRLLSVNLLAISRRTVLYKDGPFIPRPAALAEGVSFTRSLLLEFWKLFEGWHLSPRLSQSLNLPFAEQKERIPADYEMVPPLVMATAQLLFALGHNYHFYEQAGFGRCGDSTGVLDGDGVIVGATREGLLIQERNDNSCDSILGLHLMRRMPVVPK